MDRCCGSSSRAACSLSLISSQRLESIAFIPSFASLRSSGRWNALHFSVQPCPSGHPIPLHCRRGYTQHTGSLLNSQPREKTHFHDSGLLGVEAHELIQGRVQSEQIKIVFLRRHHSLFQRNLVSKITLGGTATTSVVDQNLAHDVSGNAEEMRAILQL